MDRRDDREGWKRVCCAMRVKVERRGGGGVVVA